MAIIDGVFDAELAITTREIRLALSRGIKLVGSSSMGAMRAAEVPGMVGVGRIYEMIRDGTIERDDEVAILMDAESGRALTEPLVNVRYAVENLVSSGSISDEMGRKVVAAAIELHFHDRTYRNILRSAGITDSIECEVLLGALRSLDLKREDAHCLLERVHEHAALCPPPGSNDSGDTYVDHFDTVEMLPNAPVDMPVMIWEYGERIEFATLLQFLAATGLLAD
ncbi:MAG: hypothetical protein EOP83_37425, partial [Verrucomicrobiaceae bacterium]